MSTLLPSLAQKLGLIIMISDSSNDRAIFMKLGHEIRESADYDKDGKLRCGQAWLLYGYAKSVILIFL